MWESSLLVTGFLVSLLEVAAPSPGLWSSRLPVSCLKSECCFQQSLLSCCRREVMIDGKNSSVQFRLHDKIDWVLKPYACSSCSVLSLCFSFQNMSGIPACVFFWLRPCLAAIVPIVVAVFLPSAPLPCSASLSQLFALKDLCYLLGYKFQNLIFHPLWYPLKVMLKCLVCN